jgi:hypothetical protein
MTDEELITEILSAARIVIGETPYVGAGQDAYENPLAARLGVVLGRSSRIQNLEASGIFVDLEYRHQQMEGNHGPARNEKNLGGRTVRPDLIIHRRGPGKNLVYCEIKMGGQDPGNPPPIHNHDLWKLIKATCPTESLNYQIGLWLVFPLQRGGRGYYAVVKGGRLCKNVTQI